jgi:hypothetical protein
MTKIEDFKQEGKKSIPYKICENNSGEDVLVMHIY